MSSDAFLQASPRDFDPITSGVSKGCFGGGSGEFFELQSTKARFELEVCFEPDSPMCSQVRFQCQSRIK